jgi:hypothetical protein
MLIVYQSLESTGKTDDLPSTVLTGNSFKWRVHDSLQPQTALIKSRVWDKDKDKVTFETTTSTTPFATAKESKKLSEAIDGLDDGKKSAKGIEFLAKIIERIADNASACTRPPGLVRPFVRHPDIIVLGEVYASSLYRQVLSGYVVIGGINPTGDARHRFTVLVRTGLDGVNPDPNYAESIDALLSVGDPDKENKDEDSKCMLIKVRGWLIAFVHTPNKICNNPERAALYLHNNAQRFGEGSKLDLVMGDTNQKSSDTVKSYMNGAYNREILKARKKSKQTEGKGDGKVDDQAKDVETVDRWDHSITPRGKQVVRGYTNYEVSGTNSNYQTHFDIACTPKAHVSLTGLTVHKTEEDELTHRFPADDETPSFIFHGLTDKFVEWDGRFYAYSDHNGVIVEILRDKPEFQATIAGKRRAEMIEDFRRPKRLMLEWRPDRKS